MESHSTLICFSSFHHLCTTSLYVNILDWVYYIHIGKYLLLLHASFLFLVVFLDKVTFIHGKKKKKARTERLIISRCQKQNNNNEMQNYVLNKFNLELKFDYGNITNTSPLHNFEKKKKHS
jgi:hypothetical protein